MRRILILLAASLVALMVLPVRATAEAAISGDWKLNLEHSNYGAFPKPNGMTRTVTYEDKVLSISSVQQSPQGEVKSQYRYTTDGQESVNKVQGGESHGTAQWIGDKLMIESSREFQGVTLKQREIWSLSEDGKTLTIDSHVSIPNGEFDVKQVFDRQP